MERWTTRWQKEITKIIKTAKWGTSHQKNLKKKFGLKRSICLINVRIMKLENRVCYDTKQFSMLSCYWKKSSHLHISRMDLLLLPLFWLQSLFNYNFILIYETMKFPPPSFCNNTLCFAIDLKFKLLKHICNAIKKLLVENPCLVFVLSLRKSLIWCVNIFPYYIIHVNEK